jgi:hypothetical protein
MKFCARISMLLMLAALCGCKDTKGGQRQDTVLSSVVNPSHVWRATIILRQYLVDGHFDNSPTTYVLMDRDAGKPQYDNGQDFKDSQVVMKSSQCGSLSLQWPDEGTLQVTCEKCGLALSAVQEHTQGMGAIRVVYAGFPAQSSWEAGPRR